MPDFASRFRAALVADLGDPLLNVVFLEWGAHQLGLGLPDYWNAYYFFPAKMSAALSDHLIGLASVRFLLARFGVGPAATYNLALFASFVATGMATRWLARRAGLSRVAALFAACAYTFSSFRWMHLNHLQLLWAPFLPLTLGAFDRFLERTTAARGALFVAFYLLHLTGGTYLGYMIHFPLVVILALRFRGTVATPGLPRRVAALAIAATICAAGAWLAFEPYHRAAQVHPMARNEGSLRGWGATAASFLTPSETSLLAPLLPEGWRRQENALFVGVSVAALLVAAAWRAGRARTLPARGWRRWAFVSGLVLVIAAVALGDFRTWTGAERFELSALSIPLHRYARPARGLLLGFLLLAASRFRWTAERVHRSPASGLRRSIGAGSIVALLLCLPLVYVPLSRQIPGLDGMRVPARFFAFASLGVAIAAGAELDRWRRKLPRRRRRFLVPALLALFAIESLPAAASWSALVPPERFPAVDTRIASMADVRAIAELPLPDWQRCSLDTLRMYHATAHWKPIVNGCSGNFPTIYEDLRATLSDPPTAADLERLRALEVSHLLFRNVRGGPWRVERSAMRSWASRAAESGLGVVVYDDGDSILFALDPSSKPAPSSAERRRQRRKERGSVS